MSGYIERTDDRRPKRYIGRVAAILGLVLAASVVSIAPVAAQTGTDSSCAGPNPDRWTNATAVTVVKDVYRVRSVPRVACDTGRRVLRGQTVTKIGETGDWYMIRDSASRVGWVHEDAFGSVSASSASSSPAGSNPCPTSRSFTDIERRQATVEVAVTASWVESCISKSHRLNVGEIVTVSGESATHYRILIPNIGAYHTGQTAWIPKTSRENFSDRRTISIASSNITSPPSSFTPDDLVEELKRAGVVSDLTVDLGLAYWDVANCALSLTPGGGIASQFDAGTARRLVEGFDNASQIVDAFEAWREIESGDPDVRDQIYSNPALLAAYLVFPDCMAVMEHISGAYAEVFEIFAAEASRVIHGGGCPRSNPAQWFRCVVLPGLPF